MFDAPEAIIWAVLTIQIVFTVLAVCMGINMAFMDRWSPYFLSLLRVVAGICYIAPVASSGWHALALQLPAHLSRGLVAEGFAVIMGALITMGLFTRILAAVVGVISATKLITFSAFIMFGVGHLRGPKDLAPPLDHIVAWALTGMVFLYIATVGGGPWSLEAVLRQKRRTATE
jgi:uncharacterized membrane protein YphA (DoxX/SURF4 family)